VITHFVQEWLERLGYAAEPVVLHRRGSNIPERHPYSVELGSLLRSDGFIRAQAVFDVEGVPTVVFVGGDSGPYSTETLDSIRQRIWNQNLATIVIDVIGETAQALPVRKLPNAGEHLSLNDARWDGPFSALDISSANLLRRKPDWFDTKARVDHDLLENLASLVMKLASAGFDLSLTPDQRRHHAELLTGQLLFICYLEHRDIVGDSYRRRRRVVALHALIGQSDRDGVRNLIESLRGDFNGDFLGDDRHDAWVSLNATGYELLDSFLRRTELKTGQGSLWNYDFSFIPVELLSGLYESFLSADDQAKHGAYYTPRHLATLAVEQALSTSSDPLQETIFDGACGSGILLTTAYRRLIALTEGRMQRQLSFRERRQLLISHIFGADVNFMACRVTAFSLYLSLLENLDPADITEAQEKENERLPHLRGTNLQDGDHGDFFSSNHGFVGNRFSLIISNPPWSEPEQDEITSADVWALAAGVPFARRQIAGAYALRSLEFLHEGGRICILLPIGQFLGGSSVSFVRYMFGVFCPVRLINFGDLQNLLFPNTEHTCHVFLGVARPESSRHRIAAGETFEYFVPKSDMSLAYGRLTMQSADRHKLQTAAILEDPQLLVTFMWGDANDVALWARLSVRGVFSGFWKGPTHNRRWQNRKGVHLHDASRQPVSSDRLRVMPFLPISALSAGSPILHPALLDQWPVERDTVAHISDSLLRVFDGPRVLFPDGFSRVDLTVRAAFYDQMASFTHSVGVISGPEEDSALLKFAAVYLRSTLARYFLMMRGWKMLCERNGVHLADVEGFPFFDVSSAPNPESANKALASVAEKMALLAGLSVDDQANSYNDLREEFNEDVFLYFDLSETEKALVRETVTLLMPSIRPRSFKNLYTPAQQTASARDFDVYGQSLADSLTDWRERTGGAGRFSVQVVTSDPRRDGPVGIVRVTYSADSNAPGLASTQISDDIVHATLAELRRSGLSVIPQGDAVQLVPDVHIWTAGGLFLVRPLSRRSWTIRQALRDAEDIVRAVQTKRAPTAGQEVA
jgi:hypothetical protein